MIAALLFLAQITPLPDEPKPIATTIAAIRAHPKRFDGRVVRLHGYVTACATATCEIDERLRTASGGAGQGLTVAPDKKFDEVVRPLVPTYVELDARVDAACILASCPALTVLSLRGIVSPEPPPFEKP